MKLKLFGMDAKGATKGI